MYKLSSTSPELWISLYGIAPRAAGRAQTDHYVNHCSQLLPCGWHSVPTSSPGSGTQVESPSSILFIVTISGSSCNQLLCSSVKFMTHILKTSQSHIPQLLRKISDPGIPHVVLHTQPEHNHSTLYNHWGEFWEVLKCREISILF